MSCCAAPLISDATRETLSASRIALLEDLRANSKQLVDGRVSYLLSAPAIHCGNCISTIEDNVTRIEGVTDVRANLTMKRVRYVRNHGVTGEHFVRDWLDILTGKDPEDQSSAWLPE